jgi:predicted ArsR family transcriptional regulator
MRSTLLFVRSQTAPQSADEVAAALGVHRNVARSRLERLAGAGLLLASFERRTGRTGPGAGRPTKVYEPAPELSAIEFPERHVDALVAALIDDIDPAERDGALVRAGTTFSGALAERSGLRGSSALPAAAEAVCAALRRLGFQATVDRIEGSEAVIRTPTCPLRPIVQTSPDAVAVDHGLWAGLLKRVLRGGSAATVTCETHGCLEPGSSCEVRLRIET